ncbi:MAG: acyl-CoA dehydrogenase protein [Frankiales bacterium]|nr:acyl-CoA dehydrogenase protein [Frankiales bacterium]
MQFQLTDEQRALQDAVRSYLRDRFGPTQVRELYENDTDGVPADLWKAVNEQGWLAVLVPEELDGLGLGLLDASVIARAFGAATAPGPWQSTILAGEAVRLAGSDAQRKTLLSKLAEGSLTAAVALVRNGATPNPAGAPVVASGPTLTGDLGLVEYAEAADVLVVASRDGGLHLVDPKGAGVTITPQDSLDRTTKLARVQLDGAAAERLGGSSPDVLQEVLDRAAVLVANDLAGIARKALTETVEYDKIRQQFGKPVGSFQAIKHELADLHMAVTMAEHAATYAAHAFDIDAPDKRLAASIAKSKAADASRTAVSAMIQFHGGIGYTWEHDSHFYFKRSKRQEASFGDVAQHRERIATILIDGASTSGHGAVAGESGGMAAGVA